MEQTPVCSMSTGNASLGRWRWGVIRDIVPTGSTNSFWTWASIPSKENEDRDARPVEFDRDAYRRRNVVERLIGWLKESRRIFSRFEKTAKNFGGMLKLAFIQQYLRYDVHFTF